MFKGKSGFGRFFYFTTFVFIMHRPFKSIGYAPYYDNYLRYIQSDNLDEELQRSSNLFKSVLEAFSEPSIGYCYQPGKWSVAEVIQHVIDTELIFQYRALMVAREMQRLDLPGFDENAFVKAAVADGLSLAGWLDFFESIRTSTKHLLRTFSKEQMLKVGQASGYTIRVDLLFFIMAGHAIHHAEVLKDRYLSTIES